jgi:succinoglycan biosynthesis protein ExoA
MNNGDMSGAPAAAIERVSIIVPLLDEADHVELLARDIATQDFRGALEVLVADGGSRDGSVERLRNAAERLGLDLTLLRNPDGRVSSGLNACIGRARGDLIVRLDCHSRYPSDYISLCVAAISETGAWNVGGIVIPGGRTATERAVACAMDSPFGGIGWTRYGGGSERVEVDTVTFGAFRPEAFRRAGLFDESLVRSQDDEFNLRLRRAGGRIVLDPSIRVRYIPRGSFKALARQYWQYGFWKIAVMQKHRRVVSGRSLAPPALVLSLVLLLPGAVFSRQLRRVLALEALGYGAAALAFGAAGVARRRERWRLLPRVIAAFPVLHLGYGVGMAAGAARFFPTAASNGPAQDRVPPGLGGSS